MLTLGFLKYYFAMGFLKLCPLFISLLFTSAWAQNGELAKLIIAGKKTEVEKRIKGDRRLVNKRDARGLQPLYYALLAQRPEIVQMLIDLNANPFGRSLVRADDFDYERDYPREISIGNLPKDLIDLESKKVLEAARAKKHYHMAKILDKKSDADFISAAKLHYYNNHKNSSLLIKAAQKGRLKIVTFLVQQGIDIESRDSAGDTPLIEAAYYGQLAVVKYLIKQGANINATDIKGSTALSEATSKWHKEVVKYLLEKGADINLANQWGSTPLHRATSVGTLKKPEDRFDIDLINLLLKYNPDLNRLSSNGQTPLTNVSHAFTRDEELRSLFLSKGAMPAARAFNHYYFFSALRRGKVEKAKEFYLKGIDINMLDHQGNTALMNAYRGMAMGNSRSNTEIISSILKLKELEINKQNIRGYTALHYAAMYGRPSQVEALLKLKPNLTITNKAGNTALLSALTRRQFRIAELLIKAGASTNVVNKQGITPIKAYLRRNDNSLHHVDFSLSQIEKRDLLGLTTLTYALRDEKALKFLIKKGADLNATNYAGQSVLHLAMSHGMPATMILIEAGADLKLKDNQGNTPLDYAIRSGNPQLISYLTAKKIIDPAKIKNVFFAANKKQFKTFEKLLTKDSVKQTDGQGNTPLFYAIDANDFNLVKKCLELGADVNHENGRNETPLGQALRSRAGDRLTLLLIKAGALMYKKSFNKDEYHGVEGADSPLRFAVIHERIKILRALLSTKENGKKVELTFLWALEDAAKSANHKIFSLLLSKRKKFRVNDNALNELLEKAASTDRDKNIRILVKAGANVNSTSTDSETYEWPLISTTLYNRNDQALAELLRHAKKFDQRHILSLCGEHSNKGLKILLQKGLNPNQRISNARYHQCDGLTLLHLAIRDDQADRIKLLLGFGAKVDFKNSEGLNAFEYAFTQKKNKIAKLLYAKVKKKRNFRNDLAMLALVDDFKGFRRALRKQKSKAKKSKILFSLVAQNKKKYINLMLKERRLIKVINAQGQTLAQFALQHEHYPLTIWLVKKGVNVNVRDKNHNSLLMSAVESEAKDNLIQVILRKKPSFTPLDKRQNSLLHLAVSYNRPKLATELMKISELVNHANIDGTTPLIMASRTGQLGMVKQLVEAGARLNTLDDEKKSALYYAEKRERHAIMNYLKEKGAYSSETIAANTLLADSIYRGNLDGVKNALKAGASPTANVRIYNNSALVYAMKKNRLEIFKKLLKTKPDLNYVDKSSETPLLYAAQNEKAIAYLKLMLKTKPDVNKHVSFAKDSYFNYNLPLLAATEDENIEAMRLLIAAGANVNLRVKGGKYNGFSALMLAAKVNCRACQQILFKHRANPSGALAYSLKKKKYQVARIFFDKAKKKPRLSLQQSIALAHLPSMKKFKKSQLKPRVKIEYKLPLAWALLHGDVKAIEYWLSRATYKRDELQSSLEQIGQHKDVFKIIALLKKNGFENIDLSEVMAYAIMAKNMSVVEELLKSKVMVNSRALLAAGKQSPEQFQRLLTISAQQQNWPFYYLSDLIARDNAKALEDFLNKTKPAAGNKALAFRKRDQLAQLFSTALYEKKIKSAKVIIKFASTQIERDELLRVAALQNNPAHVRVLLKAGASASTRATSWNDQTLLQAAEEKGFDEVAKELRTNLGIKAPNTEATSNLVSAIKDGDKKRFETAFGNNPDFAYKTKDKDTLSMLAISYERFEFYDRLVEKETNLNRQDNLGQDLFMMLLEKKQVARARALFSKISDKTKKTQDGSNYLFYAVDSGSEEMVDLVLNSWKNQYSKEPNISTTRILGQTALMRAVENGDLKMVKFLRKRGADLFAENKYGQTALWYALANDSEPVCKYLIAQKLPVNDVEKQFGSTPLMSAAGWGSEKCMKILLENKAGVNALNAKGESALDIAQAHRRSTKVIDMLLKAKAQIGDSLKTHIEFCAAVARADESAIEGHLAAGAKLNIACPGGLLPIAVATDEANSETVEKLVKAGADVNALSINGQSAFHVLLNRQFPGNDLVNFFLKRKPLINKPDNRGFTLLMLAAKHGNHDMVDKLLRIGARKKLVNIQGKTAADYVSEYNDDLRATLTP